MAICTLVAVKRARADSSGLPPTVAQARTRPHDPASSPRGHGQKTRRSHLHKCPASGEIWQWTPRNAEIRISRSAAVPLCMEARNTCGDACPDLSLKRPFGLEQPCEIAQRTSPESIVASGRLKTRQVTSGDVVHLRAMMPVVLTKVLQQAHAAVGMHNKPYTKNHVGHPLAAKRLFTISVNVYVISEHRPQSNIL